MFEFFLIFDCMHVFLGAAMAFQQNGSFTSVTFCDAIRHLAAHKHPGPALLILDGHSSHHELEALDM